MNVKRLLHLIAILTITIGSTGLLASAAPILTHTSNPPAGSEPAGGFTPTADDPSPPASPVKLIFIHHSCGENWLADDDGGLGLALRDNYFVSDTNYGWTVGGNDIGSLTDIGHWWEWFRGADSAAYMSALYTEYGQHSWYSRMSTDPGGENEIIMFKSCYPNSHLGGNPSDPPTGDPNPLRGQDAWSEYHTVANAKGIYNDLLEYFATRQDKLFVVITAPPLQESETDATHAANARAFNDWLVDDWLDGYSYNNVAVFDFYNVLTSNGGDANTNDLGTETGNHHRWWSGTVQHIQTVSNNYSAYPGGNGGGSHPTAAGNLKATGEFVQLLNVYYNRWQGGASPDPTLTLTAPNGGENWTVGTQHQIQWNTTGTVAQVSLAYSTDNFVTPHVIESSLANTGSYDWTIPDDPSTSVRVRVASVVSPTIYDDSDADFTISDTGASDYTFDAVIDPTNATEPVTYHWSPEPASGQGTTSATYQWSPGAYDLVLAATNCGGTVTATRTVTVGTGCSRPLTGVSISESTVAVHRNSDVGATAQQRCPEPCLDPRRRVVEGTMAFQNGVSPDTFYTGTTDATITTWSGNSYANLGGWDYLQVGETGDADEFRLLVRFELDNWLPPDVQIDEAWLELRAYDGGYDDDPQDAVSHRVIEEWVEGDGWDLWADGRSEGVTWATARPGVNWATPGGDFDPAELDRVMVAANPDGWYRWDVTLAVRGWMSDAAPNYGLLLEPDDAPWLHHQFRSSEYSTPTLRPRLVITYTAGYTPTHTVYLPLALENYAPQPVCPYPLTGVSISGPTSGSAVGQVGNLPYASGSTVGQVGNLPYATSRQRRNLRPFDFGPPAGDCRNEAPAVPPAQPTGLTAFHRSGQTFLTWNEDTTISGEGYHVYRHTAPINAGNLDQATRLTGRWGPLPEGSSIFYTDRDWEQAGVFWRKAGIGGSSGRRS